MAIPVKRTVAELLDVVELYTNSLQDEFHKDTYESATFLLQISKDLLRGNK
jgi:hypothetical protein